MSSLPSYFFNFPKINYILTTYFLKFSNMFATYMLYQSSCSSITFTVIVILHNVHPMHHIASIDILDTLPTTSFIIQHLVHPMHHIANYDILETLPSTYNIILHHIHPMYHTASYYIP